MMIRHLPRTARTLILLTGMAMVTMASAMEHYEHWNRSAQTAAAPACDGVKDPRLDLAFVPG
jgi:hypothetical protein